MGTIEMTPLFRATIRSIPEVACKHATYIYQLVDPLPWLPSCNVYQACILNEMHSLLGRHLISNGTPTRNIAAEMLRVLLSVFKPQPCTPITRREVVARKNDGLSKRRYARAKESLDRNGPSVNEARVSAFIKVEKWEQPLIDNRKPPRLIQFRTYPYCLELSRYLIPIEDMIWALKQNGLKVFAKAMNSFALGRLMRQAYELFDSPYIIMMDHSKFDASLSLELIDIVEHGLYTQYNTDHDLRVLLAKQLHNRCYTKNGIRYTCTGRKMSGEYNTSLGDSVCNLAIIRHAMETRCMRYHVIINGDDSVVFCERDPALTPSVFRPYGMKTDVQITRDFDQLEFCQSRPIQVRPGIWRMVRNPDRVMTRGVVSVKRYAGMGWAKLVNSMGLSELACNDGVPILQEFAMYLLRSGAQYTKDHLDHEITYKARLEIPGRYRPILDCARDSFALSFGISPTEQQAVENSLRNHVSTIHQMSKA